jgi:toluene monooxygenase system ferredoxin subunit
MPGDFFDRLSIFSDLSCEQRELLRPLFVPVDCYSGTVLFEQGDPAEYLYLVVTGEVVIRYKPDDGSAITVARVRPGGIVGWSAALGSRSYTSGAICEEYTQMLRLSGRDLCQLCERYPETGILVLERLAAVIAERLRNTHEQVMALLKQGLQASLSHVNHI